MKRLVKDSEDNVMELVSVNGFIPPGFTLVAEEDVAEEELTLARKYKMIQIRADRDKLLLENDKNWIIASKKGDSLTQLEADAEILRDLPEAAETAINALETVQEIKDYDAFEGL